MNDKAEFSEVSQGGKTICRTLLPKKAVIEFIGGEGKQFWSDGKNWAIPEYKRDDPMYKRTRNTPHNTHPLVGQWRVEVSPKKASTNDHFLHILQVGDESLRQLPQTQCKDGKDAVMLDFDYDGKHYSLSFDKTKNSGCTIKVTKL
jgi:heparin/heparan-sulfate lyase